MMMGCCLHSICWFVETEFVRALGEPDVTEEDEEEEEDVLEVEPQEEEQFNQ